jgi:GNAT superfamily N-acetyltransferase
MESSGPTQPAGRTAIFDTSMSPDGNRVSTIQDTLLRIERVGMDALPQIREMNTVIFRETRIINQFDRQDLLMLIASAGDEQVGFKIGYGETKTTFYSAKGGVVEGWRRQGVARLLLAEMLAHVRKMGYRRFAYDTFPNLHPGMTILGLKEGFRVAGAGYNTTYRDYRIRLELEL